MMDRKHKEGFTLIELSFSLIFIGVLSLVVVVLISNAVAAYRRGLTLNRVNGTGAEIVEDIRSSFWASSAMGLLGSCDKFENKDSCINDKAYQLVLMSRGNSGALCTGSYSYLWNSGTYFKPGAADDYLRIEINDEYYDGGNGDKFRFVKLADASRAVCANWAHYSNDETVNNSNVLEWTTEEGIIDLLPAAQNDLAIYALNVSEPAINDSEDGVFYSVSFVLGTVSGGETIDGTTCKPPKDSGSNSNYCAINEFSFSVQVGGGMMIFN